MLSTVPPRRLLPLEALGLVSGPGRERIHLLTRRAIELLGTPIALTTLITQAEPFQLSAVGLPEDWARSPLTEALCQRVAISGTPLVIEDGAYHQLWSTDPAVVDLGVHGCAAYPLSAPDGQILGAFAVMDTRPRFWSEHQLAVLETLADAVAAQIALMLADQLRATQTETEGQLEDRQLVASLEQARADLSRVISNITDYVRTVEILPAGRIRVVYDSASSSDVFGGDLPTDPDSRWILGNMVHPEDQLLYKAFSQKVLTGAPAELECRVIGMDGLTRWIWTRSAMRNEDGHTYIDGICSNVSARKENEFALEEERRRLRQAQSIGQIGSWEWDLATDTVTWSETMYELYGVDPKKFQAGDVNHHCVHPDDITEMGEHFRNCARTGQPLLYRYRVVRPKDGRVRIFEARGEALFGGLKVVRVAGTARDITAQVEAQRESASREAMLRAVLANSQSLIYVKRLDGRYLLANEPLLRVRNTTESELLGTTDLELDSVLGPVWRANDLRARQGEYAVEEWADGPNGRRYYESVKFPLYDGDGQLYATGGISLDVTARRKVAEAMAEARDAALAATAAKSAFLATMSHEIRTPMNAVIGMTDLLLETSLEGEQLDYVETIRTSGNALLAIINDILDFSRIEAGEIELEDRPFDLRACLADSLSVLAVVAGGLDLIAEVSADCPRMVRGDVNRLGQVLVNLVGNAIKFTEHGDVQISVSLLPPDEVSALLAGSDDRVDLSFIVRDTGIGIPSDRMDRLFKSFSQVDSSTTRLYGGTGLGLAISQALVQAMGGDIVVSSEVGVGSTFSFDLSFRQVDQDTLTPRTTAVDRRLPAQRPLRILLAEDNDVNQRVADGMLHRLGHHVTIVGNGLQALTAIQDADFDVVLMDIHMPTMDGLDAARAIRAQLPSRRQPRIVALTASSLPEDQRACTEAGMDGYLLKPIRIRDLADALQGVPTLGSSPPSAEDGDEAVDLAVFRQLTVEMGADSPDAQRDLIDSFLGQGDSWIVELSSAVTHGESDRVREITHTLKSSSALLGASRLSSLLDMAERFATSGAAADGAGLDSLVQAVIAEYRQVTTELRRYYAALPADDS